MLNQPFWGHSSWEWQPYSQDWFWTCCRQLELDLKTCLLPFLQGHLPRPDQQKRGLRQPPKPGLQKINPASQAAPPLMRKKRPNSPEQPAPPPEQPAPPPVQPNWCVCSNCRRMPTLLENECCGNQPTYCVSQTVASMSIFLKLCYNKRTNTTYQAMYIMEHVLYVKYSSIKLRERALNLQLKLYLHFEYAT